MFDRIASLFRAFVNSLLGKMENPEMMLEQTYQDLQNNLIQVRQAVAQAIATEKQLEGQLLKNREQAETWQNRAAMAVQQGRDDLAREALQRKTQFTQAATDLEAQLAQQKQATAALRTRLTELEGEVQKAYTKKQVLIARDRAAQATTKANEILSKTTANGALTVMDKMEQKVIEKETRAAALSDLASDNLDNKFKSFEGQMDVEMELLALKNQVQGGSETNKLISETKTADKEPVLIEVEEVKENELNK